MRIFNGKKIADKILEDLKEKISKERILPTLAVIYVNSNPESELYIRKKRETSKEIGIRFFCYVFKKTEKEEKIIERIRKLNSSPSIDGIIVQLPLPKGFNTEKIIEAIDPKKDVDGFHKKNRELLKKGRPYFFPVLPQAIFLALKKVRKKRKKILALVNSDIFGKTLEEFLKKKRIKVKYLIFKKKDFPKIKKELKKADIIISVLGKPFFLKGEMIKKGVALIDGGIRVLEKGKIKGDVDRESVKEKASFLTPVPGGIGPLTVALLLKNVYLSAKRKLNE